MVVNNNYKPVVKKLARFGCFSIGTVYVLVGIMALLSFLGETAEDAADEERIMDRIMEIPLGEVIIGALIIGLLGYIIWRVFEAITDPYKFGNDAKGLARRIGIALSASGYALIAFSSAEILFGERQENGEEEQQIMVAEVLNWTAGAWLVGAVGVIVGLAGLVQFKYVIQGDHNPRLAIEHLSDKKRSIIQFLAHTGYFARGLILLVIGYLIVYAAVQGEPGAVGDTDSAFDFIGGGVIGSVFLVLVAIGTICYGAFMYVSAVYYSFRRG
ncbi:DUF1206 domain-containing protein [Cytophagaceae bacterium ABcell3]|nr:DUF1206 domain-containing protein [Cytophagaceae bacterium ABcell3]